MANPFYNATGAIQPRFTAKAEEVTAELNAIEQGFVSVHEALQQIETDGGFARYSHYAYADSADGEQNFTTGEPGSRAYIGIFSNSTSATPSENPADYRWARISGVGSQFQDTRYIRSASQPARPGADDDVPTGSSTTIPPGTNPVWQTTALRSSGGALLSAWSAYVRITDYAAEPYDATKAYYRDAKVLFNGGTYILIVDTSTGNPPSGTAQANAFWDVIAAPGGAGEPSTPPSAFSATIDLTSSSTGVNLRTLADAAGYTGLSNATITFRVPNAVTIQGAANGGIAIDSGTWPSSTYAIALTLVVQSGGVVRGGGGRGGDGGSNGPGSAGEKGGDAIYLREAFSGGVTINSGGTVQAGGGGGGGGASSSSWKGGGGGGGGRPNGSGGAGAGIAPEPGIAGTTGAAGSGGDGGTQGDGGNGGSYGTAGSAGETKFFNNGGPGGAAGYAVRKNGKTATVTNNGTMAGAAS